MKKNNTGNMCSLVIISTMHCSFLLRISSCCIQHHLSCSNKTNRCSSAVDNILVSSVFGNLFDIIILFLGIATAAGLRRLLDDVEVLLSIIYSAPTYTAAKNVYD